MSCFCVFQELGAELAAEKERLKREKDELMAEFERVKGDLSSRLQYAEGEVCKIDICKI